MTRTARLRALLVLLFVATAFGAACGDDVAKDLVSVSLYNPSGMGLPTFQGNVAAVRVSVFDHDAGEAVAQEVITVEGEDGSGVVPEIPFGENLQLYVEALTASGITIASGGTQRFARSADDSETIPFLVYLTQVGTMAPLKAVFTGPTVEPTPIEGGPRTGHTATLLPDGRVLLTGGATLTAGGAGLEGSNIESITDTIVVINPRTAYIDSLKTPNGVPLRLTIPRAYHTASVLPDGRLVIVGGLTQTLTGELSASNAVEILTFSSDGTATTSAASSLGAARAYHAAAVRSSGGLVIAGGHTLGLSGDPIPLASVEYMPSDNDAFLTVGEMGQARTYLSATAVGDLVVLLGGLSGDQPVSKADLFLVADGSFNITPLSDMSTARYGHAALRLSTDAGRYILVAGGYGPGNVLTPSFEVFDTERGQWAAISSSTLNTARARFSMLELHNDEVVVAGGIGLGVEPGTLGSIDNVEVMRPQGFGSIEFGVETIPTTLSTGRFDMGAVVMDNGMAVFTGGARMENGGYAAYPLCDVYNPGPPATLAR